MRTSNAALGEVNESPEYSGFKKRMELAQGTPSVAVSHPIWLPPSFLTYVCGTVPSSFTSAHEARLESLLEAREFSLFRVVDALEQYVRNEGTHGALGSVGSLGALGALGLEGVGQEVQKEGVRSRPNSPAPPSSGTQRSAGERITSPVANKNTTTNILTGVTSATAGAGTATSTEAGTQLCLGYWVLVDADVKRPQDQVKF